MDAPAPDVASAPVFTSLPPLSLYVHLPWCLKKCPYCDFNSHEVRQPDGSPSTLSADVEQHYLDALCADLESALPQIWGRRVHSVFIGGGTPSLFPAGAIDALLSAVRARMPMEPGAEVTLEANPGTVEAARFRGYREAGVNRISVGVQSFDDGCLRALGRIHSANEARRAVGLHEVTGHVGRIGWDVFGPSLQAVEDDFRASLPQRIRGDERRACRHAQQRRQ